LQTIINKEKTIKVPFLDLKAQYESIKDEINEAIKKVIDSCAFAGGPFVAEFEKEFAKFCGIRYSIGVGSGTEALWLTLLALGISQGDEVVTVPNTFIATVEAISFIGAKPVFIDIDEKTYTMNPELLEKAITSKTKAIIPVHLFGQMADMDPIMDIAKKHGIFVIEDACQAHGAEYKGKKAGSIGEAGCFSFYPGKNLGSYGEAGAVVTDNSDLQKKISMLRDHGQGNKYYHDMIGWNARMDGIQGAVLSVKLKHLAEWNEARRNNARLYTKLLSNIDGVIVPQEANYGQHIYHIYAIRAKNRNELISSLKKKDIYTGIHYPVPVHLQNAYKFLGLRSGCFPIAENCAKEFISLPMFSELAPKQIDYVVREIMLFYEHIVSTSGS
jgi:dTDP-4-amino-4,6-dideoxygalactose transaminase